MRKEIRILFTSIGRRVELVQRFKEAAEELNEKVYLYGADVSETAPALSFCDVSLKVCRISDINYIPLLVDICESNKIDLLIPTIDTDLLVLSQNKDKFLNVGTEVFISSPEMISFCRDKRKTEKLFEKCGILAPKACDRIEEYNQGYPAFIKPLDGSSSIDAYVAKNWKELEGYADKIKEYIVQPFVEGTEYTVDIMCDFKGNPIFITPRERMAVRSGEVLKTKIVQDTQIIEESIKLIDVFKPCGPITVQLIRTKDKKDYFIEINPRFGGGAPLSMKAGADAAKATIEMLCGKERGYVKGAAKDGSIYSRYDQSICINEGITKKAESVTSLMELYMKYQAVIFDLDDTLYSEKQYVRSGYKKITEEIPELKSAFDNLWSAFEGGKPAIDTVLKEKGIYSEALKSQCLNVYRNQEPEIVLYENVEKMLWALKKAGKKLGIITDGRVTGQKKKLEKLGLYGLVDEVVITDELAGNSEVSRFRKPNTIAFEIIQKRFGVRFEEMIYIGDNLTKDFEAPKRLGMGCAYIANPDGLYRSK